MKKAKISLNGMEFDATITDISFEETRFQIESHGTLIINRSFPFVNSKESKNEFDEIINIQIDPSLLNLIKNMG